MSYTMRSTFFFVLNKSSFTRIHLGTAPYTTFRVDSMHTFQLEISQNVLGCLLCLLLRSERPSVIKKICKQPLFSKVRSEVIFFKSFYIKYTKEHLPGFCPRLCMHRSQFDKYTCGLLLEEVQTECLKKDSMTL